MKFSTLRTAALWLALAGVLYRSLIPAGFMPAAGDAAHAGALLMLCPHGEFHGSHGSPAAPHPPAGDHGVQLCPFGTAGASTLPGAAADVPVELDAVPLPGGRAEHRAALALVVPPPARAPPALS